MKNFILLIGIALCLLPFGVFGATHTVTSNGDDNSANQLRTLIGAASPGDEIVFALSSGNETITLSLGQLTIDKNLTIDGSNSGGSGVAVTIQAASTPNTAAYRVLNINSGTVSLNNLTIRHGNLPDGTYLLGAGLSISGGANITIDACHILENSCYFPGGGIYLNESTLTIANSTIANNVAEKGGGIFSYYSTFTMTNSTVYNNTADYNYGGGLYFQKYTATIINSTICENSCGYLNGGGGIGAEDVTLSIKNTILANNTGGASNNDFDNYYSTVIDNGSNIVEYSNEYTWSATGDITGEQANLFGTGQATQTLADNGGPTQTLAILEGSVATGAGIWDASITTDQRGESRSDPPTIGAFEYQFAAPTLNTSSVSNIATTSATMGGNITDDGGASVTERGVVYSVTSTNSNPQINGTGVTKNTNGTGTGTFSESITSLSEFTNYSVQAYAINSEGTSYGGVQTFTTLMKTPGNALDFDGSDYVQANTISFQGSSVSIEAWVRARSFNSGGFPDYNISDLVKDVNEKVVLRLGDSDQDNNKPQFVLSLEGGTHKLTAITQLNANQWYNIAATYDGTTMKLYINGALDNSLNIMGGNTITSGAGNLVIGGNSGGRYLDGKLDEIRVWNDTRSSEEILANMCQALDGDEDGLIAYYNFNSSTGNTLYDISSNGHNGTLYYMDNADWVNSYAMVITEDATDVTDDSFTANWDCPAEANSSYDDGYTIQYSTSSVFSSGNDTETALISDTSKSISGLTASTTYYYRVSGKRNGSETLEYSNVKSFTTDAAYAPKYALDFERDNSQYANCGTINLSGSAITLECWIKPESFQTNSPYISQIMGTESGTNSAFLRLGDGDIPAGNKIEFVLYIGSGQVQLTSTSTLETGRWYHIAGVYDGSNMKIYINGVQDASNAQTGSFTSNSTFYLATNDGSGRYFDGTVDEVRVWKTARSSTDINTYMTTLLNGNETNLEAYYRCDNGSGTALSDITSNGHNANLVNTPSWPNSYAMVIAEEASSVTFNGFTANWDCPAEANSSFDDGYTIQYSTTSDFTSGNATTTALISDTSKAITGLPDNTTYYYRVSGKRSDSPGTMEYSNVKSAITSASSAPEYALDFDGSNDYVTIPNSGTGVLGDNSSNESFTIETWFKYAGSGNYNAIFTKHSNAGGNHGYFMEQYNTNYVAIGYANTTGWATVHGDILVKDGNWHHLAYVYNSSVPSISLYVDGVLDGTNTSLGTLVHPASDVNLALMASETWGSYTAGQMDEVRVWNDARTPTEIQNNMCSRLTGTEDNLLAYYRFDNGSGTTLSDVTSNGHNGTLNNMDNADWINSYAMVIAEDASSITFNGFTANWDCPASANSSYDGYRIEYSENQDFSASSTTDAPVSETGKSITGLSASTTYYYRVGGIRSSSVEYSNVKSFETTAAPLAPDYCLNFDGGIKTESPDYASKSSNVTSNTDNFTMMAWIYPDVVTNGTNGWRCVAYNGSDGGGYGIGINGSKLASLFGGKAYLNTEEELTVGRWYHIALRRSGGTSEFFLDGSKLSYSNSTAPNAPTAHFSIGNMFGSDGSSIYTDSFDGKIDEVIVFDAALSDEQIANYTTTAPTAGETNMVAYYNCNSTSGSTVFPINGNSSDNLTLINATDDDWVNSYAMVLAEDATNVDYSSFTANWDCPGSSSSFDGGYTIQYSTSSDFSSGNTTTTASNSETSKSLTGLSMGITYYYRVSGKRSDSETLEYSNIKSLTTTDGPEAPLDALDFDGTGDYVSINSVFGLGTTNATIEAWVYIPSTIESGTFARLGRSDSGFGIGVGANDFDHSGNELLVLIDTKRWIKTNTNIGTGWHHVAFSVGSSNEVNIYLDGVNVYTEVSNVNTALAPVSPSYIAAGNSTTRIFSGGKIDEVRYWSDVRSESEIQNNMCNALVGNEDGLVAYYRCDNGSGTSLSDITGNGYTGSLNGDPSWVDSYAMVLAEDATSITNTGFTANWDNPGTASNFTSGYTIQYSTSSDFASYVETTVGSTESSKSFTGLSANTTYYYRVSGDRSGSDNPQWSNVIELTTASSFSPVVTSNADDGGTGTLRYIMANCTDGSEITFNLPAGNETIVLGSEINITFPDPRRNYDINGANTAGSGTPVTIQVTDPGVSTYRIFWFNPDRNHSVTIENMTLRGGDVSGLHYKDGGCVYFFNVSTATLTNVTLLDSKARNGGAIICQPATDYLNMTNCLISNTEATGSGGGVITYALHNTNITSTTISNCIASTGGGLDFKYTATANDLTINGCTASSGGGISISGNVNLTNTKITNNTASSNGGGIYISNGDPSITSTTISGNSANKGGGIYIQTDSNISPSLNNSTLSNNSSTSDGGGIYAYAEQPEMSSINLNMTISSSTICGNTSGGNGAGLYAYGYGEDQWGFNTSTTNVTFNNSILTYNSDGSGYEDILGENTYNFYGDYNIIGGALIGGNSTNYSYSNGMGSALFENYSEILANTIYKPVLADNGGNTETVALASNSIANGTGSSALTYDQRGYTRNSPPCKGSFESNVSNTWQGDVSSDWNTSGNWSADIVPGLGVNVSIPNVGTGDFPVIAPTDQISCHDLTISEGASLNIQSSSSGTGSLIIKGDVSNSGTITSQSYLPGSPQAWHMFSSPAVCDISENEWNPGANDDFFAWLETSPGTWINYKNITTSPTFAEVNGSDNFVAGKGYLVAYNSENPTKFISGTLNTGNIIFPLANTSSKSWTYNSGWNLMGNPYSSSIDWSLADLSKFQDNYAYIYNPNKGEGGGFITVDGGAAAAFIPPHQGFFVVATEAAKGENFTFSPAMQTHGNSSHIYKEKEAENSIVLILKAAQYYDETKIRIDSRSTWKRDRYDALKLFSYNAEVPQLYSLADDDISLAINGIPEAQSRDYMPLGLLLPEADHYEIALLSAEGSFAPAEILLEDKNTGTRHKLKSSSYHFNGEEGLSEDRFVLIFKGITGIDDITEDANINIWQQGDQIILQGDTEIKRITLTDITGRTLGVWKSTENIPAPSTAGVYLVTAETDHNRITKKIIIK